MGSKDRLGARLKAVETLGRLYATAQECLTAHQKAGMPVPREVSMLIEWGQDDARREAQAEARDLVPIAAPIKPIAQGWISVPITVATPITIVQAILQQQSPLTVGELVDKVRALSVTTSEGSIHNIGTKLAVSKKIFRSGAGWHLANPAEAPVIDGDRIWGLPEWLQIYDVAAHRREAVWAYMQHYGRLSRAQLIDLLTQSDWVNAPINVSLVKADLQDLFARKLIKRAKSDDPRNWDWEIVKKKGALRLASSAG